MQKELVNLDLKHKSYKQTKIRTILKSKTEKEEKLNPADQVQDTWLSTSGPGVCVR